MLSGLCSGSFLLGHETGHSIARPIAAARQQGPTPADGPRRNSPRAGQGSSSLPRRAAASKTQASARGCWVPQPDITCVGKLPNTLPGQCSYAPGAQAKAKSGQKSYQARFLPKKRAFVCAESSDLSIAFLPAGSYNQTIDSNGAVGHLLTRSAVFVKTLSCSWHGILRQPGTIDGRERK